MDRWAEDVVDGPRVFPELLAEVAEGELRDRACRALLEVSVVVVDFLAETVSSPQNPATKY